VGLDFAGAIVGPPSALIMFVGDMAVVIGLWPVHVFCTYRTIAMYDDVSPLLFAYWWSDQLLCLFELLVQHHDRTIVPLLLPEMQ
jgi:hypothetical protein